MNPPPAIPSGSFSCPFVAPHSPLNPMDNAEESSSNPDEAELFREELLDSVFSWSLNDILNKNPYKAPPSFPSRESFVEFFRSSLMEETRLGLRSSLQNISRLDSGSKLLSIKINHSAAMAYRICLRPQNRLRYRPGEGDILALCTVRPRCLSDLEQNRSSFTLALVMNSQDEEAFFSLDSVLIKAAKPIGVGEGRPLSLRFAVCLFNVTKTSRIWTSFRMCSLVIYRNIAQDSPSRGSCTISTVDGVDDVYPSTQLNEFQKKEQSCDHKHRLQLVLGSPGTEKTTEFVTTLLCDLFEKKCRTVISAPTNMEVLQISSSLFQFIKTSRKTDSLSVGDVVIYGTRARQKIEEEGDDVLREICLEDRVKKLEKCSWWNRLLKIMSSFLRHAAYYYNLYRKNVVRLKKKETRFKEFALKEFTIILKELQNQAKILCLHLPSTFISEETKEQMVAAVGLLESFLHLLRSDREDDDDDKELKKFFNCSKTEVGRYRTSMGTARLKCLEILEQISVPIIPKRTPLADFCLENATIVLCTCANSFKLRSLMEMGHLEAVQTKECQRSAMVLASKVLGKRVSSGCEKEEILTRMYPFLSFCNEMIRNGDQYSISDIEEMAIAYEEKRERTVRKTRRR
ncbi:hypothetical protein H6P81_018264 [Aristolochia fimbriata]|uniref:RNA helicase n=1 Tax=Aristolochia fimbriata TaxID=158543 RepID=A0AAV7E0K4_ARIFI|nr:hypothetical protein H6P81_018264 [Aristolochia fimbriata]